MLNLPRELFPQELTVADAESALSINPYYILVKLVNFSDEAYPIWWGVDPSDSGGACDHQLPGVGVFWCVALTSLPPSCVWFVRPAPCWQGCRSRLNVALSGLAKWV